MEQKYYILILLSSSSHHSWEYNGLKVNIDIGN